MSKEDIIDIEKSNRGMGILFPDGLFYHAYEMSAYIIYTIVSSFEAAKSSISTNPPTSASPKTSAQNSTNGNAPC